MDIQNLNGIKLNLLKKQSGSGQIATLKPSDSKIAHLIIQENIEDKIRPIINDKVVDGYGIGPEFDSMMTVSKDFISSLMNLEEIEISPHEKLMKIPMEHAYDKLQQVEGLSVRFMPSGSLSTINELRNRKQSSRISKRERHLSDIVDEETPKRLKKEKKEKKEKKSKEHKSDKKAK